LDGVSYVKVTEPAQHIRRVKVDERQEVWLGADTYRDYEGYMAIDVVDPPKSDMAILAAMTAFLINPVNRERVERALEFRLSDAWAALAKQRETLIEQAGGIQNLQNLTIEEIGLASRINQELGRNALELRPLLYALDLVLHYRPELRGCSFEVQLKYAWKAAHYANDFLKSLRNLRDFLAYGAPDRRLTPAIKQPERDVRAAVLRDVEGKSYREIGEYLVVPAPPDFEIKGEHQTVRKMVENGRSVLQKAFGVEGWQDRAETMRAERAWWQTLSSADKRKEHNLEATTRDLGMSIEEVRRRVERGNS
jgi:hypothetical protein